MVEKGKSMLCDEDFLGLLYRSHSDTACIVYRCIHPARHDPHRAFDMLRFWIESDATIQAEIPA